MSNNSILLEKPDVLTKVPSEEPFICLFSGGKDSALALSIACKSAKPVSLITCVEESESLFHNCEYTLMNKQSERMGIPITYFTGHWKSVINLSKLYRYFKKKGVKTVVFGDLWDVKNANRKIQICQAVGLKPCMPLWKMPYDEIMYQLAKHKIKSVITVIRSPLISEQWLGKVFDENAFNHFKNLGIDPLGENGEFHTTLVDADIFSSNINYRMNSAKKIVDKFGEKLCANLICE